MWSFRQVRRVLVLCFRRCHSPSPMILSPVLSTMRWIGPVSYLGCTLEDFRVATDRRSSDPFGLRTLRRNRAGLNSDSCTNAGLR